MLPQISFSRFTVSQAPRARPEVLNRRRKSLRKQKCLATELGSSVSDIARWDTRAVLPGVQGAASNVGELHEAALVLQTLDKGLQRATRQLFLANSCVNSRWGANSAIPGRQPENLRLLNPPSSASDIARWGTRAVLPGV